jgi:hypothetical protein
MCVVGGGFGWEHTTVEVVSRGRIRLLACVRMCGVSKKCADMVMLPGHMLTWSVKTGPALGRQQLPGRAPTWLMASGWAPARSSSHITSMWAPHAARCSAVLPSCAKACGHGHPLPSQRHSQAWQSPRWLQGAR